MVKRFSNSRSTKAMKRKRRQGSSQSSTSRQRPPEPRTLEQEPMERVPEPEAVRKPQTTLAERMSGITASRQRELEAMLSDYRTILDGSDTDFRRLLGQAVEQGRTLDGVALLKDLLQQIAIKCITGERSLFQKYRPENASDPDELGVLGMAVHDTSVMLEAAGFEVDCEGDMENVLDVKTGRIHPVSSGYSMAVRW